MIAGEARGAWTNDEIKNLNIDGLDNAEKAIVSKLLLVWKTRLAKNLRRTLYFDTEKEFQSLGLTLPPVLSRSKMFLSWPAMAVEKLAQRSIFEGFRAPGQVDPFDLSGILADNHFELEFSQAVTSAYTYGVSFVTVARGGEGEPAVQIQPHSVEWSAALWDKRHRRISAAMTISEMDSQNSAKPAEIIVYLADSVLMISLKGKGSVTRLRNPIGRVLAVPVTYKPRIDRPFGKSRITNSVMALTDMAVRSYVRMEGNAEFYSTPQIAILGAAEEAFNGITENDKFRLAMDRLLAITKDADGDKPELKQLQQASMQPHSDMLRTVAMAFSGETSIPVSSLGIIHDNPSSAEAIRAAERDLLIEATYQNKNVLGPAAVEIAQLAVMVRDKLSEPTVEMKQLSARFADPEFQSLSTRADAVVKLVSGVPALAESEVVLEQIFDEVQIERIRSDISRQRGGSVLDQLLAGQVASSDNES